MYRGKEIFKPLNTGWVDEHVACVREWVANIFFYRKGETTIMVDAGYNYDRLEEKMGWLGIDPKSIRHILITHQDTDHVGAVEADSPGLFRDAKLYIGEIENKYLTGEVRRKVIYHLYKLPQVTINNEKVLLHDGQVFEIDGIKIECFLVPGHTWGHMVYLIDDRYLFTGDTIWFGADGGYSFISALAEDNKPLEIAFSLDLNGTGEFSLVPLGRNSELQLTSNWPHPGFLGSFLPTQREVSAVGYRAHWQSSWFANDIGSYFKDDMEIPWSRLPAFSADVMSLADQYQLTDRATKYAILLIGLTFMAFFVFESLTRRPLHPMQYLLVGLSLVLFYLVLLALSEHIGFTAAWLAASLSGAVMNGIYLQAVLRLSLIHI